MSNSCAHSRETERRAVRRVKDSISGSGREVRAGFGIVHALSRALEKGKREYSTIRTTLSQPCGLIGGLRIRKRAESKIADVVPRPEISVETKISQIMRALSGARETTLKDLFRLSRNRSAIVATFLAVLELCRRSSVRVFGRRSDYRIVLGDKDRSGADE